MKAIVIDEFGGPEKLHVKEVQKPSALDSEVLVQVAYAGVNPVDRKIREGFLKERLPHVFPIILGWDVSGTVVEIGKAVKNLKVGDQIYSYIRKPVVQWGAYAEYVAIEAKHVVRKPSSLTLAESAAVPLSGLTAWQALFDNAHLKKGETVLILGGSGGVGSLAIQFAQSIGAKVIATSSPEKHDYIKKIGAQIALDHKGDLRKQLQACAKDGVDVVFDCFGKEAFQIGLDVLKKGGRMVSILEHLDPSEAQKRGITTSYVFVQPSGPQLQQIADLIDKKKVISQPVEEIPLKEAAAAQEKLYQGKVIGKLVLKVVG